MASLSSHLISFSTDGEFLAYCGADGRLKILEAATGILKQEYTPSSHLSALCTCLSWSPKQKRQESPSKKKKKKRKESSVEYAAESLNVIGMGTLPGKILLYSVGKGELHSEMTGGHSDSVNCLSWNLENDDMFSCSHDSHIIQWSISKGRVKSKWKADRGSVHSVVILPDGQTLLTAGRSIKWWDIERQQMLKKFSGHASHVIQLRFLSFPDEAVEEGYFISAAGGDRHIIAWQLKRDERDPLASFLLDEEPVSFDISTPPARDQKVMLTAVTKSGVLHVFEHQLNGKRIKPLMPDVTLRIALKQLKQSPSPWPIVCCQIREENKRNLLLAYGSMTKIVCEKLPYTSNESSQCYMRNWLTEKNTDNVEKQQKMKLMTPDVSSDAKVLAPGFMVPSLPTQDSKQGGRKRKLAGDKESAADQLPMEERLSSLTLELPSKDLPSSENLAHLLIQGLHSQDEKILDRVFERSDGEIITKTVQRLPIDAVVPLLKELHHRLHGKWTASHSLLHWLRIVLSIHTSYLTTCSNLDGVLSPLYQLMDARVGLFQKLIHLKGRMELIVSQIESRKDSESAPKSAAVLVYQDESSDEANSYIDDLLLSHSESEPDNWDEFSDDEDEEGAEKSENEMEANEEDAEAEIVISD